MMKRLLRLATALLLLLPGTAWGESYRLFTAPGVQSASYDRDVAALKPGDVVEFSNGARFEVKSVLGSGNLARVLSVGGGKAIRIPLKSGRFPGELGYSKPMSYMDFIDEFLKSYKTLKEREAPVVEAFPDESLAQEYAVVEQLSVQFDYAQWLAGKVKLAPEQAARVKADFVEFARRTWGFSIVGDQHTEQIVYAEGKGWLFLDFDARNKIAINSKSGTIFTKGTDEIMAERYFVHNGGVMFVIDKLPTPRDLHTQIMAAIDAERLRRGFPPPFSCAKWLKEKWVGLTGRGAKPR